MSTVTFIVDSVLNTLWQSAIVIGAVWTGLRFSQIRLNAATRYVIWWITLVAVLTLPWIHRSSPAPERPQRPAAPALQHELPAQVAPPLTRTVPDALVTVTNQRTAKWPLWVFAIWSFVFVWHVFRMTCSYFYLRGVKRRATSHAYPLPPVRRKLRLLVSTEIASPMAAGFLRPAVLIPDHLRGQLTPEEFHCVVLHECAHLARYDDWLNIVGRSAGALAALHPVVGWILRQIEREREVACDDWVVARTGAAHSYAEALTRIAELRINARNTVLASRIFSSRSRLRDRVEMLVRHGRVFTPAAARKAISLAVLALASLAAGAALAPHWIAFAQRPEFEVASVKENTTNVYPDFRPRRSGELFMMHNTRIFALVNYAYNITSTNYQVDGYDRFPESDKWYDIDARIPNGATDEQVRLMVQSLLEDRFKFKAHRENREIAQYALVVDKGRAKLSPATDRPMDLTIEGRRISQPEGTCSVSLWREGARWTCKAVSIDKIIATAGQTMRAPVVDRTGLNGSYDVNVRFIPDNRRLDPDAPFGPTFEQALREELGLRLEKGKGEIQVLVIDHMEKPSEN
jgi:uncharacterized protein (TIGR03435 family)